MKKTITLSAIVCTLIYERTNKNQLSRNKKIDHVDTYFGEKINDPVSLVRRRPSAETEAWVKAQNVVTMVTLKNSIQKST